MEREMVGRITTFASRLGLVCLLFASHVKRVCNLVLAFRTHVKHVGFFHTHFVRV